MARPARPSTQKTGMATARAKLPWGKTVGQEAVERSGRATAAALPRSQRLVPPTAGVMPFTGQDFIPDADVRVLRTGYVDSKGNRHEVLDSYDNGAVVSPILNPRLSTQQVEEWITFYDSIQPGGVNATWNPTTYQHNGVGSGYVAPDDITTESDMRAWTAASPLSVVPTPTTNPNRPRTVAAGFSTINSPQAGKGKLTVVFRDGTYYNYYGVTVEEWQGFKDSPSPGHYIRTILDYKSRGDASVANLPPEIRALVHRVARTEQYVGAKKATRSQTHTNRTGAKVTIAKGQRYTPRRRARARQQTTRSAPRPKT